MSFVSVLLESTFLSIVSDGQVSYHDKNIGNNYQKFFKINDKLIVTGTGNKDLLDRVKVMLFNVTDINSASAEEVGKKLKEIVYDTLEGASDIEGNEIETVLAVCGINNRNKVFFDGYRRSGGETSENHYEISDGDNIILVTLDPPDVSFNTNSAFQSLFNQKQPKSIKQVQRLQKDLQRMVARASTGVNNVSFTEVIINK